MRSPTVGAGLGGMGLGRRGAGDGGPWGGGIHGDGGAWGVWGVTWSGVEIQVTFLMRGVWFTERL